VTAGGRQLECTPSAFLAADIGEIEGTPPRLTVANDVLRRLELAAEIRHRVCEVTHTDRLDAGKRSFGARLVRADDPLELVATRTFGDREHAADPTQTPVERKLATRSVFIKTRAWKLVGRCE